MALIVPSRLRSQPQWPAKINRGHPKGSLVTAAFAAHYGNGHVELIRGHTGSLIGTGLSTKVGAGGTGAVGTSSNGGYAYTSRNEFCPGAAPFSVELLYTNGSANAQFDRIWEAGPITQSGKGWDLEFAADGLGLNFTDSGGTATLISAGTTNTVEHVVATLSGTATLTSYQNGKVFQAATTVATGVNYTNTNSWLYAFSSSGHTPQGTKLHFIRFYQGTVLSAQDVRELYARPWDMFSYASPIRLNTIAAVVAAKGGTLPMMGVG